MKRSLCLLVVGKAREPALACDEAETGGTAPSPGPYLATHRVIRVVRGRTIVTVLDVRTMLQGFDTGLPRIILQLELSKEGMSVRVEDRGIVAVPPDAAPDEGCTKDTSVFARRLCAGRGTFRWRGGRFVRSR